MSDAYFLTTVKPFSLRSENGSDVVTWRVISIFMVRHFIRIFPVLIYQHSDFL